ncbi:MAG: hypothetical protein A2879_01235 [Omnitrophica WOR_2 bacterium RIFCSPHIGHO2_01_FULL_49_10]|nr:MAG: hypothetical protein A2879_01235 [Omnitrophica WOR_2 bacterium RIFCSPHIGHO2_01_FULL_49_10]OGX35636.1 MAG: hypothetical protein A3I43_00905 [Omnitrophica WOR_2 bacterium RIFCSPLOWO2_02_FULL_50_19]
MISDFLLKKYAPSVSEGALDQIRRESGLISEVSQILLLHKKMHGKNPGYPAKRLKTPSGFFAAALRANFAIAKFGMMDPRPPSGKTVGFRGDDNS